MGGRREIEDGMGFSGLVPSREEKESERHTDKRIADLAMMVARLIHQLNRVEPDNPVANKAIDYLRRANLIGPVFRSIMMSNGLEKPGNAD